jgi:hypothetical protein
MGRLPGSRLSGGLSVFIRRLFFRQRDCHQCRGSHLSLLRLRNAIQIRFLAALNCIPSQWYFYPPALRRWGTPLPLRGAN